MPPFGCIKIIRAVFGNHNAPNCTLMPHKSYFIEKGKYFIKNQWTGRKLKVNLYVMKADSHTKNQASICKLEKQELSEDSVLDYSSA
ncbi:hypothetical protein DPMN_159679 [Dreissena polymorpha]|uniref:Uncharacterized protein n=1 Tax=Dreissena polymorpha TaxID=45954 RepID=A0A9D4IPE0_DREPO|nr:hypothetical protein DPMN_159679 [Dreissena polymorpha]